MIGDISGASAAVCDRYGRACNLIIWQIGSQSHPVMIEFGVSDILQLCHEQTFRACFTKSEFSCGADTIARRAVHNRENSARCKIFVILIRQ